MSSCTRCVAFQPCTVVVLGMGLPCGGVPQVDHHGDNFLIVNNGDAAKEFKLSITPIAWPGKASWQDVMPYDPATRIAGVEVFKSFVVVTGRQNGLTRVWTMHMKSDGQPDVATRRLVEFDEELMEVDVSSKNMVYDADVVRLEYSSMTRPPSVADYNPTTRELKLIKQSPCPNYDPTAYRSRRIMVKVRDGTEVPVSLVYRKDAWPDDGSAPAKPLPLHLYGYACTHTTLILLPTDRPCLAPPATGRTASASSQASQPPACASLTAAWCTLLRTSVVAARWGVAGTRTTASS